MDLEKMRKSFEGKGYTPEMIEDMIEVIRQEQGIKIEDPDAYTVKQASSYLILNLDDSWNEPKVRRYIASGKIVPMEQMEAKYFGYRIHKKELERFVQEHSMTKEDWMKLAKELQKKVDELEKEVEELKSAGSKEIDDLINQNVSVEGTEQLFQEFEEKTDVPKIEEEKVIHVLTQGEADRLLDQVISDNPEFESVREEFLKLVFEKDTIVKWFKKDTKRYRNPTKHAVGTIRYIYDSPYEAIKQSIKVLYDEKK